MATATLKAVTDELRKRMGPIPSAGVENCRPKRINGKLRPDRGYSEHAWGNAEDLRISGYAAQKPYVDELNRMKRQGYPVGLILWAGVRSDHTGHIHVEGSPALSKGGAKPPCAGGKQPPATIPGDLPTEGPRAIPVGVPTIDIPLLGDIGPVVYRGMFLVIAVVAVIIVVTLVTRGLAAKTLDSGVVGKAVKAVT